MAWCFRQQAITWAYVDLDICYPMAALGYNELRYYKMTHFYKKFSILLVSLKFKCSASLTTDVPHNDGLVKTAWE